jgi:uncharacterized protein YbjQ (UPF0145 family)
MASLPNPHAEAALQCLTTGRGERHTGRRFSSNLSVDEAILLKEIGYEPLGLVVGSAVYHIGWQTQNWTTSEEMAVLTNVMYAARADALERLEAHAHSIGGHGVVGTTLDVRLHHGRESLAEFVAMGTAVANPAERPPRVWLSDLSGQDLYLLIRAGYQPMGLAFGACVYHIAYQGISARLGQATQNVARLGKPRHRIPCYRHNHRRWASGPPAPRSNHGRSADRRCGSFDRRGGAVSSGSVVTGARPTGAQAPPQPRPHTGPQRS